MLKHGSGLLLPGPFGFTYVSEAALSREETGLEGKKHRVSLILHLADQQNFCVRMDERFKWQVERFIE